MVIVNGKCNFRVVEDGVETVTVEENGKLVQKTVNGSEAALTQLISTQSQLETQINRAE